MWNHLKFKNFPPDSMNFVEILFSECIHQGIKILKILSLYRLRFRNYDRLKYGPCSRDPEPLKFLSFWNCFYSAILNRKHLKFGLAIHLHEMISKTNVKGKINFTWIWAVIMDLGGHKVAPSSKIVVLVQISSSEKIIFAIFERFKIKYRPLLINFIFDTNHLLQCISRVCECKVTENFYFYISPFEFHDLRDLHNTIFRYCYFCKLNTTSHNLLFG